MGLSNRFMNVAESFRAFTASHGPVSMALVRSLLFALLLWGPGCQTTAPLAPVDLSGPGWETRQGQAIWRSGHEQPEIAGDVVIATHPTGSAYFLFSKTLPIVSGRIGPRQWAFEIPGEDRRYSGRGRPPKRLVWLQLLRALEGGEVPDRWRLIHPSDRFIALENDHTGERVEVQFFNP